MRKYYYLVGQDRVGPLTLEELKSVRDLTSATLVWYEGLPSWTRAVDVSDLSSAFISSAAPPPLPKLAPPPLPGVSPPPLPIAAPPPIAPVVPPPAPPVPPPIPVSVPVPPVPPTVPVSTAPPVLPAPPVVSPPMPPVPANQSEQKLFAHPFSFKGRIRRLEYGLSSVIGSCVAVLTFLLLGGSGSLISSLLSFLISTVIYWFVFAQGSKRCHDIGRSGWWQLIPFYNLYVLFAEGSRESNKYGFNPKLNSSISDSQKKGYIAVAIIVEVIALTLMIVNIRNQYQGLGLSPSEREEILKILREESAGSSAVSPVGDGGIEKEATVSVSGTYSGGAGTKENPYLISSRSDMELLSVNVNNGNTYEGIYFLLTCDLVSNAETVTTVIGTPDVITDSEDYSVEEYRDRNFSGTFDGGGHSIVVSIGREGEHNEYYAGIFGSVYGATIKNLTVSGVIIASYKAGGICAHADGCAITGCVNRATISASPGYVAESAGGIVGYAKGEVIISDCYNRGEITASSGTFSGGNRYCPAESSAGGIAGRGNVAISNCHNSGKIVAESEADAINENTSTAIAYAGGIIGESFNLSNIRDSYNSGRIFASAIATATEGEVETKTCTGGIAGTLSHGAITNCYNIGAISYDAVDEGYSGGICGWTGGSIRSCFSANAHITGHAGQTGRIVGEGSPETVKSCYALSSMLVNGIPFSSTDASCKDGCDALSTDFKTESWYAHEQLFWDFGIWSTNDDSTYPVLRSEPAY